MTEKLATWAKEQANKEKFIGIALFLLYKICVDPGFQSAIHIIASCLLGAFCYRDGNINWRFIIPFGITYLFAIFSFCLSNKHRKVRNNSIKGYEISYSQISKSLQEECRKDEALCKTLVGKPLGEISHYYNDHDIYTETCIRICNAVNDLLNTITDSNSFRVITFLRTTKGEDEYHINGYSPQEPVPEAYNCSFKLAEYQRKGIRKKCIPVHARPFIMKRFEPIIYLDKEVRKEYLDFNDAHPTKLHISIPCSVNGKVVAVLQITSYENLLGNKSNIKDLIENVLVIFTSYLKTAYIRQMEHELISAALSRASEEV